MTIVEHLPIPHLLLLQQFKQQWYCLAWLASNACCIGWIHSCNRNSAHFIGHFCWTKHNTCWLTASQMETCIKSREFLLARLQNF